MSERRHPEKDPDFMESLARGLAVLECFSEQRQRLTIQQVSSGTGLSRGSARRCLHTLVKLGYAARQEQRYSLRPKTLRLGYAFLSSNPLAVTVQPYLERLRDEIGESCSFGVLEGDEVFYIARAEASRIMSIGLRAGSRLPLYCTSMGRVLLSGMGGIEQLAYLSRVRPVAHTARTVIEDEDLLDILRRVAEQGYAVVDQELEVGLRSIAIPLVGKAGLLGSLNLGAQAARVTLADLRTTCLPALRRVARDLAALGL